jgi:CO/xanthine dehydrogenase Mo-binding subunit
MKAAPHLVTMKSAALTFAPIMRDDLVRWNGEPVAVVVADSRERAEHAATFVDVAYEESRARLDYEELRSSAVHPPHVMMEPATATATSRSRTPTWWSTRATARHDSRMARRRPPHHV